MNKKVIIAVVAVIILLLLVGLVFFLKNEKYTVTFRLSSGAEYDKQEVKKGEKVKEPEEPTRDGYSFAGWFEGDKEFDFNSKIDRDITLIAKWEDGMDKLC